MNVSKEYLLDFYTKTKDKEGYKRVLLESIENEDDFINENLINNIKNSLKSGVDINEVFGKLKNKFSMAALALMFLQTPALANQIDNIDDVEFQEAVSDYKDLPLLKDVVKNTQTDEQKQTEEMHKMSEGIKNNYPDYNHDSPLGKEFHNWLNNVAKNESIETLHEGKVYEVSQYQPTGLWYVLSIDTVVPPIPTPSPVTNLTLPKEKINSLFKFVPVRQQGKFLSISVLDNEGTGNFEDFIFLDVLNKNKKPVKIKGLNQENLNKIKEIWEKGDLKVYTDLGTLKYEAKGF